MIDAGVPGMRRRVAVIKPPLTEPTYIATRKASALCPSIPKVSGSESEINIAPVSPGMAPTVIPSAVPSRTRKTRLGDEMTSKIIGYGRSITRTLVKMKKHALARTIPSTAMVTIDRLERAPPIKARAGMKAIVAKT